MQSYTGRLQELGQATINHRTRHSFSNYSYLQVGDAMVKNIACWHGLDGKLQQQLGEDITLYTKNGFVEAFKASDGKTYSGERTSGNIWILFAGFMLSFVTVSIAFDLYKLNRFFSFLGCLMLAVAIFYIFYRVFKFFDSRANEGADQPNAIRIPKA